MSEYWKSTPSYWCKFCKTYVRDTALERKNHDAKSLHQNNIQRSIRELGKTKEREQRDQQRAKDEVARLNGLVDGKGSPATGQKPSIAGLKDVKKAGAYAPQPPMNMTRWQQRKQHAEQLAALGVALPEELKREVTGVGGWQTVSERVIEEPTSVASIKQEEGASKVKLEDGVVSRGVHKRKADDDEDERDEEAAPRRKVWGTTLKSYPGANKEGVDEDLEALLSGVAKKTARTEVKGEDGEDGSLIQEKVASEEVKPADAALEASLAVKQEREESAIADARPVVMFKKRKGKR